MPSITTWFRLEPGGSAPDISAGVAARIHDPLWLLGRQWQVGEFQGEDGGTPIVARWRGQISPLTRYVLGPLADENQTAASRLDLGGLPLEALVERQPVAVAVGEDSTADGLRLGVETGQYFLRILADQSTVRDYRPDFLASFAVLPPADSRLVGMDPATLSYLGLVLGRAVDGRRLRAELKLRDLPVVFPPVEVGDRAEVRAACATWLAWADTVFSQPDPGEDAWLRDRMEYAFSVTARLSDDPTGEYTLTAAEYPGGALDWYSVDRNGNVNLGTTAAEAGPVITQTVIPAPVTVRGVPAPRFWEFEDALLDLGALQANPTDLPQLLMLEAMSGYGNDWFIIPVDLPTGSLVATRSLVVVDTFGAQTLLRPNGDPELVGRGGWNLFELALPVADGVDGVPVSNALFLAPSVVQPLEGPTLEEVLLIRDEMANLAWAVERRLESPMLESVDAANDVLGSPLLPDPGRPTVEPPDYRLATAVPPHWIPLMPQRIAPNSPEIRLARASLLDPDGSRRVITSRARLLGDQRSALLIPEEEVPRAGVVVRRSFQAARDPDGRLHVWSTNRKSAGRGEGSSGLRFDTLTAPDDSAPA